MKDLSILRMAAHAALAIAISVSWAAPGFARMDGITGVSGKNGTYCSNCHAGGVTPTVAFEGPTTMDPGAIATFRFSVTSHSALQVVAGLDVAASGGTFGLVAGQGTRLQFNEVTHTEPKLDDTFGVATFEFTWEAPTTAGRYTLYGAGNSANDNGERTGDKSAKTTYVVVVGDVPATCVGDCGGDGEVTVNELIIGVNIALDAAPVSACPVFDVDGDGAVTVNELIIGVNIALNSCPM